MKQNHRQIGGTHYAGEYQHWDWVSDMRLDYLLGCSTKYVARWRKKNGIEDLEKALHYLDKRLETTSSLLFRLTRRRRAFVQQKTKMLDLNLTDHAYLSACASGNLLAARSCLQIVISCEKMSHMNLDHPAPFGFDPEEEFS